MASNEGMCDNNWHTIKVMREGPRIILQIDNDMPSTGKYKKFFILYLFIGFFIYIIGF